MGGEEGGDHDSTAERRDLPGRTDKLWMNPESMDKVENAQTKRTQANLTRADRQAGLASSAQSIKSSSRPLQNGLRKMQWPGNGRVQQQAFERLATSPDKDKAHAHGACSQMRHGMCVRRQLIWRRPELEPRPADRCPCRGGETERRVVRWGGRECSSATRCQ